MHLGTRVLRGPNWDQSEADGGEGHLGTVVGVKAEEETAEVVWDNGQVTTCRLGKEGMHDLRIYDNATTGVQHRGVTCNSCRRPNIYGFRWHCAVCPTLDFCSHCYFIDVHDVTHEFERITKERDKGERVASRQGSTRTTVMGMFTGAKVVRGRDWASGDADGGAGARGVVVEVVSPDSGSARNAVRVSWDSGQSLQHRLGLHGKVDLVCTEEAPGPACYVSHLPVLSVSSQQHSPTRQEVRTAPQSSVPTETPGAAAAGTDNTGSDISVGNYVQVKVDEETFSSLQKQRGGWTIGMSKCMGKMGRVKNLVAAGTVDVVFEGQKWRINLAALEKVEGIGIQVGDTVRILSDEVKVRELMQGRTNWTENMKKAVGKVGTVLAIDGDGDYRVQFVEKAWFFNPEVCLPAPGCPVDFIEKESSSEREVSQSRRDGLQKKMEEAFRRRGMDAYRARAASEFRGGSTELMLLFSLIDSGRTDKMQELLEIQPELVSECMGHGTALHYATYGGRLEPMRLLVALGADVNKPDPSLRTPLMRAVDGNSPEGVQEILSLGADINRVDDHGVTALHRSFLAERNEISRLLLQRNPDLNIRAMNGQTALFEAVKKRNTDPAVLDALLAKDGLDLHVVDQKGFKAIHSASLKNRPAAVAKMIALDPSLVNAKERDESYLPIHIAANNDHTELLHLLIRAGSEINPRTRIGETPLHMSCTKIFIDSTMILVEKGADLNAQDSDGDTPLHNCLGEGGGSLRALIGGGPVETLAAKVQLANYLIQMGARTDIRNHRNQTALDMASGELRDKVEGFMAQSGIARPTNTSVTPSPKPSAEEVPSNTDAMEDARHLDVQKQAGRGNERDTDRKADQQASSRTSGSLNSPPTPPSRLSADGAPVSASATENSKSSRCVTCSTRAADVIFLPCAHKISCRECGPSLETCPKCRQPVRKTVDTGGKHLEQSQSSRTVKSSASQSQHNGKEIKREDCKVQ